MHDLSRLFLIVTLRTLVFKLQLFIRFLLNGRCYPSKEQRDNGTFKDYWIGWVAYKYFSDISICNGWLKLNFPSPSNDLIFTQNIHGDKMSKNLNEIRCYIKINNKISKT